MKGFTLLELLIAVAIIGILTAVAVPAYMGHITESKAVVAKNNLRQIYLQQQEYFTDNQAYYFSSADCDDTDDAATINNILFSGSNILTNDDFNYCISQTDTDDFTAYADQVAGDASYTIDQDNNVNF